MQITKKRGAAVGAAAALCLIAGTSAFAYWTTTGSGSGSAATGTTQPVTIKSVDITGLYPGGPATTLSGTFDNPNPGKVYVGQVSATMAIAGNAQVIPGQPACTTGDFTLVQPTATNAEINPGVGGGTWSGGSIALKDNPNANQDNCKNIAVTLTFTSN